MQLPLAPAPPHLNDVDRKKQVDITRAPKSFTLVRQSQASPTSSLESAISRRLTWIMRIALQSLTLVSLKNGPILRLPPYPSSLHAREQRCQLSTGANIRIAVTKPGCTIIRRMAVYRSAPDKAASSGLRVGSCRFFEEGSCISSKGWHRQGRGACCGFCSFYG